MSDTSKDLSRRRLLARIGTLAVAGYTAPALTTISVAHAASGSSSASSASSPSEPSSMSSASSPSEPSDPSEASAASNAEDCAENGGTWDEVTGTCDAV